MGFFKKHADYSCKTTGSIIGVSSISVNKMHLPIAEYEVEGKKYTIRVPHHIAVKLENQYDNSVDFVRANLNFGTNVRGQITKIQGCEVKIAYNPEKPKEAKVIE